MRVVLVDDEDLSRRALRVTLERELPEVEIVGEAADGQEAVDMIPGLEPDLVIMDIRMPEVDGIEAAYRLREAGETFRLVFLTAHDEFDYARSAVDLDADAYLLKPVQKPELVEVLGRCAARIVQQRQAVDAAASQEIRRLRDWAHEQLVTAVAEGNASRFETVVEGLGYESDLRTLVMLAAGPRTSRSAERLAGELAAHGRVAGADLASDLSALVVFGAPVSEVAARIRDSNLIDMLQDIRIRIAGFSRAGRDTERLCRRLASGLRRNEEPRLALVDLEPEAEAPAGTSSIIRGDIRLVVAKMTLAESDEALNDAIDEVAARLERFSDEPSGLKLACLQVLTLLRIGLLDAAMPSEAPPIETAILESQDSAGLVSRTRAIIRTLLDGAREGRIAGRSWRLSRAVSVINAGLGGDLYLDAVAAEAGIGPQHLSRLFREELDTSFTRFVNDRRMEHARFLLATSTRNIAEVAEAVGFRDPNYFGKVFRKSVGVTPTVYRSRYASTGAG